MGERAIVIVKAGDPALADAMERGILAARAQAHADLASAAAGRSKLPQSPAATAPSGRELFGEGKRPVNRSLLRVAVGNHKTAEDYANMRFEAELEYGESVYELSPARKLARKALGLYGLLVVGLSAAYRAQDRVLGGAR